MHIARRSRGFRAIDGVIESARCVKVRDLSGREGETRTHLCLPPALYTEHGGYAQSAGLRTICAGREGVPEGGHGRSALAAVAVLLGSGGQSRRGFFRRAGLFAAAAAVSRSEEPDTQQVYVSVDARDAESEMTVTVEVPGGTRFYNFRWKKTYPARTWGTEELNAFLIERSVDDKALFDYGPNPNAPIEYASWRFTPGTKPMEKLAFMDWMHSNYVKEARRNFNPINPMPPGETWLWDLPVRIYLNRAEAGDAFYEVGREAVRRVNAAYPLLEEVFQLNGCNTYVTYPQTSDIDAQIPRLWLGPDICNIRISKLATPNERLVASFIVELFHVLFTSGQHSPAKNHIIYTGTKTVTTISQMEGDSLRDLYRLDGLQKHVNMDNYVFPSFGL
jgi:hypothetical protein